MNYSLLVLLYALFLFFLFPYLLIVKIHTYFKLDSKYKIFFVSILVAILLILAVRKVYIIKNVYQDFDMLSTNNVSSIVISKKQLPSYDDDSEKNIYINNKDSIASFLEIIKTNDAYTLKERNYKGYTWTVNLYNRHNDLIFRFHIDTNYNVAIVYYRDSEGTEVSAYKSDRLYDYLKKYKFVLYDKKPYHSYP